ncbi:MAG: ABC-F type ribosomal protection protein [Clostridiales bacterium]|nr:ABC-F type ribosomal protection protein [Clostridiales bacterium]
MSQIVVNNLTFSYDTAYENIFEQVSFRIDTDWRLGFIGRNGRGKTTFLNLLMGKYEYKGSITASVNFDYFPFEVKDESLNTLDIVKNRIAPFAEWERQMEHYLKLATENEKVDDRERIEQPANKELFNKVEDDPLVSYGRLQELYQANDGYIIEELIEKELGKLQVDLSVLSRPFSTLSYGERTKVMLAALFLKKNNFLLIDEPTNHLDMEGRDTLAEYLQGKKGFILVSHDRAFLDRCIDHVLSINRNNIEVQKGNYSTWQKNKEWMDNYELEKNEQLKKDISSLSEAARRAMGWSDKVEASKIGGHVFDRGAVGHKAAKMMKRAKAIENRKLEAIEERKSLLKNIEQPDELKMNVLAFPKKRFIEAEDLCLYYGNREVVSHINFTLMMGERIALAGGNGSGKSSLLKLLLGEDITYRGRYFVASGLKISYISQDTSYLSGSLEDFSQKYGLDETIFKTVLRQLDFSRTQFEKDISEFSGGQKKKVLLAKSLAEPAHLFIWDEPLNFVDVYSRIQIEELLLKYLPTMIFVEHDRVFREKISTKVVELSI